LDRLIGLKGESQAVKEMRKHMAWYLKGLPRAARYKDKIMEAVSREEMVSLLHEYVDHLEAGAGDYEAEDAAVVH